MKFGGASVKDAEGVRNVAGIIHQYHTQPETKGQPLAIVVSAMDKTTNALELLAAYATQGKEAETKAQLAKIEKFHYDIIHKLFGKDSAPVEAAVEKYFTEIAQKVRGILLLGEFPARIYDRIMAYGELVSSVILHQYLLHQKLNAAWADARQIITTDSSFKQAEVVWNITLDNIQHKLESLFGTHPIVVIQGYIASNTEGKTTTLGREGSDFTASILGYAMNARRVLIWKDVPGVMSADPRVDADFAQKIDTLSYETAVEMTFYGASVIHPKTIKPLQNKAIPLHVKCFKDTKLEGTVIQSSEVGTDLHVPSRIHKKNQALVTLRPRDFSFMDEYLLRTIFDLSSKAGLQINLVQTSAITVQLCIDNAPEAIQAFVSSATDLFTTELRTGLLLTSLLYHAGAPLKLPKKEILLLQQNTQHLHLLMVE
jgi:aspartate kinase